MLAIRALHQAPTYRASPLAVGSLPMPDTVSPKNTSCIEHRDATPLPPRRGLGEVKTTRTHTLLPPTQTVTRQESD